MSAPVGNSFWEARSSHGRAPIFGSPEELWAACAEYFAWTELNPLYECKAFSTKEGIQTINLPKMRAMTLGGLCIYLDIDLTTWHAYRGREDFTKVTTRVDETIRMQKFQGAAADLLNANIIARDLGLTDRSELNAKHDVSDQLADLMKTVDGRTRGLPSKAAE
jgi:hypothetical protein